MNGAFRSFAQLLWLSHSCIPETNRNWKYPPEGKNRILYGTDFFIGVNYGSDFNFKEAVPIYTGQIERKYLGLPLSHFHISKVKSWKSI